MRESIFITAPDGLTLHVAAYGEERTARLPVVCLPGLSRTVEDFDVLARALAGDSAAAPRRVLALDYRGRGLSDYDPDPGKYTLATELGDVVAMIEAMQAAPAVVIGTSRGGLLAMLLAALRPDGLAGVVLNDIGPVIEAAGLTRIKSYVGWLPEPRSFEDGAEILARLSQAQFPKLEAHRWLAMARRSWRNRHGRLVPTYDPALARTLEAFTPDAAMPAMWEAFDALRGLPLLTIRGANSDILSVETVAAMAVRHPGMEVIEVRDQGHAPLLDDAPTIAAIASFVAACDGAGPGSRQQPL